MFLIKDTEIKSKWAEFHFKIVLEDLANRARKIKFGGGGGEGGGGRRGEMAQKMYAHVNK
jgi:hypothetical protein